MLVKRTFISQKKRRKNSTCSIKLLFKSFFKIQFYHNFLCDKLKSDSFQLFLVKHSKIWKINKNLHRKNCIITTKCEIKQRIFLVQSISLMEKESICYADFSILEEAWRWLITSIDKTTWGNCIVVVIQQKIVEICRGI